MVDEEWIRTLADGRKVKFIYQELPEHGVFITAQHVGNEVVYSVVLSAAKTALSHEEGGRAFRGRALKKVAWLN
jgi:hypothetical protein